MPIQYKLYSTLTEKVLRRYSRSRYHRPRATPTVLNSVLTLQALIMAGDSNAPPLSEKDRLHAQYNQQSLEPPPTPTSTSLGSPLSPLNDDASSAGCSPQRISTSEEEGSSKTPSYSEPASAPELILPAPTSTQPLQEPFPKYPGLPALDYQLYLPPHFKLSSNCTTLRTHAPHLSSSAPALVSLIRAQAAVPPKPQIHITGRRNGRTDFALKLNLMPLLVPDSPPAADYLRVVRPGETALRGGTRPALEPCLGPDAGLDAWARRFVKDPAPAKAFVLTRAVAHLDTRWLEGRLRDLVAGTGYAGAVAVTFPVAHARVVVVDHQRHDQRQNPGRVAANSSKLFTALTTLLAGGRRTYEVACAVWPFASCPRGEEAAGVERTCTVQSEEQWWREWAQPIRYAILTQRHGWVTNEDRLEALMEGKGQGVGKVDWGDGSYA